MPTNLFFALKLPDKARTAVDAYAQSWRRAIGERADIKWYAPEDYHITLKFLGQHDACEEDAFATLGQLIATGGELHTPSAGHIPRGADKAVESIDIRPLAAGAFPSMDLSRILWVGVDPTPAIVELAERVDNACASFGIAREERQYRPHITVARCRDLRPLSVPNPEPAIFAEFTLDCFVLMRTTDPKQRKSDEKLRYNTVQTFALPYRG